MIAEMFSFDADAGNGADPKIADVAATTAIREAATTPTRLAVPVFLECCKNIRWLQING